MTHDDTKHPEDLTGLMPEVETLETWLTNTMRQFPEPPCRVIEQVKSRTGIAASEFVLDGFVAGGGEAGEMPTPSAQTLLNVKAAVKRELAFGATERKSHRWFRYSGAVMALATAAVIALVIIPTGWRTSPADGPESVVIQTVSPLDDLAYVLTVSTDSGIESELDRFQADMDDFADSFVNSEDEADELGLDEIDDAIDALFRDSDAAFDT